VLLLLLLLPAMLVPLVSGWPDDDELRRAGVRLPTSSDEHDARPAADEYPPAGLEWYDGAADVYDGAAERMETLSTSAERAV
jgi:hypothetical protein